MFRHLLIFLHYFSTIFKTINRELVLQKIHSNLATNIFQALLGFHALSGCDQSGRFSGFSKESCWKTLLNLPEVVLHAVSKLGSPEMLFVLAICLNNFETLEQFVIRLYCNDNVPYAIKRLYIRFEMETIFIVC